MAAWDGNGAMYVVQMRSYMQNLDAKGEKDPVSRITRHVDTNGDGTYDKHTIYADGLVLPRFVLPLDDRVMVGVTDTLDLWTYRDTTGDGVADEQVKVYEGGRRGGNMEHQPSGLTWGLDNWLYLTYEAQRYRFTGGELEVEKIPRGSGQWGVAQDDWGRMYFSDAGGEKPAIDYQQPLAYGSLNPSGQQEDDFHTVYPIAQIPDAQGGLKRIGKNGGVNNFTGCGGQSIYRGDRLPEDLYGDLIIPETVGRLIRRAKVDRNNAKTVLRNAYPKDEFIRTRDVNFRPVWTATTPGGQMAIVDMHRGIIQQGNWTKKGSYLREVIEKWGLQKEYRQRSHLPSRARRLQGRSPAEDAGRIHEGTRRPSLPPQWLVERYSAEAHPPPRRPRIGRARPRKNCAFGKVRNSGVYTLFGRSKAWIR